MLAGAGFLDRLLNGTNATADPVTGLLPGLVQDLGWNLTANATVEAAAPSPSWLSELSLGTLWTTKCANKSEET